MPLDAATFNQLKAKMEAAKSAADQATGAAQQQLAQIKTDYGYSTLEEAERGHAQAVREANAAEAAFDEQLAAFQADWEEPSDE